MRGRARLVFSAVTVGGICAAFVAPSASLAMPRIRHTRTLSNKSSTRLIRAPRPVAGGGSVFQAPGLDGLPHVSLIDFSAASLPAVMTTPVTATTVTTAPAVAALSAAIHPPPVNPAPVTPVHVAAAPPIRASGATLGGAFACIRSRESGGNYATNTGNGYYGAYQFKLSTWRSVGGTGLPNQAPPAVQDALAQRLQQRSGWGQWSTHSMCGV